MQVLRTNARNIALRWSAVRGSQPVSINIGLRWSQSTSWLRPRLRSELSCLCGEFTKRNTQHRDAEHTELHRETSFEFLPYKLAGRPPVEALAQVKRLLDQGK